MRACVRARMRVHFVSESNPSRLAHPTPVTLPLPTERNALSSQRDTPLAERQQRGKALKDSMAQLEAAQARARETLLACASALPCDTHPDAPVGDASAARLVATLGAQPVFDFAPRSHEALGEELGLFDLSAGASMAGAGWAVLTGDGVLLELALVQWTLSRLAARGFTLIAPPDVAHTRLLEGCGFNPRPHAASGVEEKEGGGRSNSTAASQVYALSDSDLCLIGTAEIPLAGLHEGAILSRAALPARYAAVSHCFRREAGGYGASDRGLYRLHQFTKVEMFAYVAPSAGEADGGGGTARSAEQPDGSPHDRRSSCGGVSPDPASDAMLQSLLEEQMAIFSELGLHCRVLDMPTQVRYGVAGSAWAGQSAGEALC